MNGIFGDGPARSATSRKTKRRSQVQLGKEGKGNGEEMKNRRNNDSLSCHSSPSCFLVGVPRFDLADGPGGVFADEGFVVGFGAAEGGEIGGGADVAEDDADVP